MKRLRKLMLFTISFTATFILFIKPAYAYLDPGTFTYFLQILIAGLVGISVTIKLYWSSIISFFKNNPYKNNNTENFHNGDKNNGIENKDNNTGSDKN